MAVRRTLAALLAAAVLAVGVALPGTSAGAKGKPRARPRTPAVQVRASPVPGKADTVRFTVHVGVARHRGVLYYHLSFGDESGSGVTLPAFCLKGPIGAASRTWHVTHHYHHRGTYQVTASGGAVCSRGRGVEYLKVHVS